MVSNSKEYSLAYYYANKKGDLLCDCGKTVKGNGIYKHRKTKVHQRYLDSLVITSPPILDTEEEKELRD